MKNHYYPQNKIINTAIQEFKAYSEENIYSIEQIKFWLSENGKIYNSSKLNWNNDSCYGDLPCCHTLNNEQSKFINFYKSLKTLLEYHEYESYFKKELIYYKSIKNNVSKLKEWVIKNEELGAAKFVCFFLDYLDYSDNPYHLKIFILNFEEFQIFVDRKYFDNTISFLEIFNKLFWEEKILPDSIERMNKR